MKELTRKDGHEDEAILAHDQCEPSAWRSWAQMARLFARCNAAAKRPSQIFRGVQRRAHQIQDEAARCFSQHRGPVGVRGDCPCLAARTLKQGSKSRASEICPKIMRDTLISVRRRHEKQFSSICSIYRTLEDAPRYEK
jgi:hypothetical protein